mmetsp:Transcript_32597/g.68533  ORF Transcript_32597/g.68533 Transcript_32597/m.68533 type:complete len:280 (-) Transcript_32597:211-1050(-)
MSMMEVLVSGNNTCVEMPGNNMKHLQLTTATLAMGRAMPSDGCSAPASLDQKHCLFDMATTFEPLKVCLDDDSSIEDGDEDMFDDDAFTFGDEDFQALMSHEAMRRVSASQISHCHGRSAAQHSHFPLHRSVSLLSDKDSSHGGSDSLPSTAASSQTSLATLALTSHTSCTSISPKTRSKRRVSLHDDVAVIHIPMRTEYSNLIRERIWSSAGELHQNAARNALEFAAEGFDWRNVADDAQMVQTPSGERIHPIHFMNIAKLGCRSSNFEQKKIMPSRG